MNLKYDLLPKEDRAKLRAEMVEQMVLILAHDGPECKPEERRKVAIKLVNEAIARERGVTA